MRHHLYVAPDRAVVTDDNKWSSAPPTIALRARPIGRYVPMPRPSR